MNAIAKKNHHQAAAAPKPAGAPRAGVASNVIIAFVGENENDILRQASQSFMDLVKPHGFVGHVINLLDPASLAQLQPLLDGGILFGWGAAGIGADLKIGGVPLWDTAGIPFISVLADTPALLPTRHYMASRYVANGYQFHDWLKIQRRLVRSPQLSAMLPLGALPNPLRDSVAWSDRQHRMVLVKTGCAPAIHRGRWAAFPKRFVAILEDTTKAALQRGVGDITDIFLDCVDHHGLNLDHRSEVLFGLMAAADAYIRDFRSTAMVEALLDLPVDIIGRGWNHLVAKGGRARFHNAINATTLPGLYANTQFLLNTMPNFSTRTHERVLNGFAAKACVVTNENEDMRARFGSLPSYIGVDTESPDLAARLAEIFHSTERYDDQMQPALDLLERDFSPEGFVCGLIELAIEIKAAAGAPFTGYRF